MGYVSKIEIELDKIKNVALLYEDFFNLIVNEKMPISSEQVQKLISEISGWYDQENL